MHRLTIAVACAVALAPRAQPLPREVLEIGAAAAAKLTASAVFVAGRTVESVLDGELSTDDPLVAMLRPFLDLEVDREACLVTATVAGVSRRAWFRPGLGCTIVFDETAPARSASLGGREVDPAKTPWPLGDLDAVGELGEGGDQAALAHAVEQAFVGYAKPRDPRTRAVIVVHRGKIVAERYADGFDRDTPLHGWSMAKSVVDALVGVRVRQGVLDVDEPVELDAWDDDREITLEQMLRMTAGLAWSERYDEIDSDVTRMLFGVADASGFAAAREVKDEPGSVWGYSSGTTNVICRVLRSTFDSLDEYHEFPRAHLFRRIGMNRAVLEPDPSGTFVGSSFLFATAREWARFGLLYLRDGEFDGGRILPKGWVAASTKPTEASNRGQYGRHWWLNAGSEEDGSDRVYVDLPRDLFYASGHEGQIVAVVPSRDAVLVRLGCTKDGRSFRNGPFLRSVLDALPPEPTTR